MTVRGSTQVDEETPLLQDNEHDEVHDTEEVKETPIPWGQFSITLVLQLAEPMSSQVLFPCAWCKPRLTHLHFR